jgi:hypothetical protein
MTPNEILSPYAKVAISAKQELAKVEKKLIDERDTRNQSILKKQRADLKHLIDRCFRLTGDFVPAHVSDLANNYILENQLGDIFSLRWGGQIRFEKKKNRNECKLKHEHKIPVSTLVKKLKEESSIEDAVEVFESQVIVWVHKAEDEKLPKNNRPNPDEAYNKAGIVVIKNQNPFGHLFGNSSMIIESD